MPPDEELNQRMEALLERNPLENLGWDVTGSKVGVREERSVWVYSLEEE
jgi:hypothetical protein